MRARRRLVDVGAGLAVALVALILIVLGSIVIAVARQRSVDIPLLLSATTGSGQDIMGLVIHPFGFVLWLSVLSAAFGLPLAMLRARGATPAVGSR